MANCRECGHVIPEGYKICPTCGAGSATIRVEIVAKINLLRKKVEQSPSDAALRIELADLYESHGLLHEALDQYLEAAKLEPANYNAHMRSAQISLRFRQLDRAEKAFAAALHIDPKSQDALVGLFRSYYLQDKTDIAITLGETIIRSKPENVEFHKLLKELYTKKGDRDKLLNEMLALHALIPKDKDVVREIAAHYLVEDKMESVIEFYSRLTAMAGADVDLAFQIGKYYFGRKEYGKTVEYLSILLKTGLAPSVEAAIMVHLGLAYFNAGDPISGLKMAAGIPDQGTQSMNLEEKKMLAELFFSAGKNQLEVGQPRKAVFYLEKAAGFDPTNADYAKQLEKTRHGIEVASNTLKRQVIMVGAGVVFLVIVLIVARALTRGRIVLNVEPMQGIALSIDEKAIANPIVKDNKVLSPVLPIGKHTVAIEREGYEPWQAVVGIGLGRNARVDAKLVPIYYSLRIASVPESADVFIDGHLAGKTPFMSERILASKHVLALEYENHARWTSTLVAGKTGLIDLGTVRLKNLTGVWSGKIGDDATGYRAAFTMTIKQTGTVISVKYYHQPREGTIYTGDFKGRLTKGQFRAEGEVLYRYLNVFYWEKSKKDIVMQGVLADDWSLIEGTHSLEGFGEHDWSARRTK